jgi:pSer/pThr/pTyr-binding forkhead associated (FHA) protein
VKDEPPSLFCFLDAHHINGRDIQRLRIFTQGPHRVLLCPLPLPPSSTEPRGASATSPTRGVVTAAGHPQSSFAGLQILSGPSAGGYFSLDRDSTIISTRPDCEIMLQSEAVSRQHAAFVREGGGWVLRDLGSTDGTFVNGTKLTSPAMLQDGDIVGISDTVMVFGIERELGDTALFEDDPRQFEMESDFDLDLSDLESDLIHSTDEPVAGSKSDFDLDVVDSIDEPAVSWLKLWLGRLVAVIRNNRR